MYYEKIPGWFTFKVFYDMILKQKNSGVFVEIGVLYGRSIVYMAEMIKMKGYSVDLFGIDVFETLDDEYEKITGDDLFAAYEKNIEPVKDYITTIKGSSHKVYKEFKDESIDFLFIDGDHHYTAVKKDIKLWLPKMKPDGIISGHDYNWGKGDIKRAVDEIFPKVNYISKADVWFVKLEK